MLARRKSRVTAERTSSTFVDHNKELFGVTSQIVTHQFASLYFNRLMELRPKVEAAAVARWGEGVLSNRTKTLDATPGTQALIVGCLYREMSAKPNHMEDMTRDFLDSLSRAEDDGKSKYCGKDDTAELEDESGRIALRLPEAMLSEMLVTGAVVGLTGTLTDHGELEVDGLVFPGLPPQAPLVRPPGVPAGRYVAMVSGLRVGQDNLDMLPLQLLAEHLTGQLGGDEDHALQANIVRLIIAGNATSSGNVTGGTNAAGGVGPGIGLDAIKKLAPSEQKTLAGYVRTLDQFLTTVGASMPVDLIPGAADPCNFLLPQQPFHPALLPHASQLSSLNLCTNPYCTEVDGVRLLGSAGQPLDDMMRYVPTEDRLAALARSLECRHLAPTAPDTLPCFPFADKSNDPFVVQECPHVYFAANQPRFETAVLEGPDKQRVRTILVPDFALEHTCVLLNLDTLDCRPITFAGFEPTPEPMQL